MAKTPFNEPFYKHLVVTEKKCDYQSLSLESEERLVLEIPSDPKEFFFATADLTKLFKNSEPYLCSDIEYTIFNKDLEAVSPEDEDSKKVVAINNNMFAFNPEIMHAFDLKAFHFYIGANNIQDLGADIRKGEKVIKKVSIVMDSNECKVQTLSAPDTPKVIQVESLA